MASTIDDQYVGSKITIPGGGSGMLRFIGEIHGKSGTFAGVELIGPSIVRGKNSGDVDDVRYFDVRIPGTGLFLPYTKLKALNLALFGEPTKHVRKHRKSAANLSSAMDNATPLAMKPRHTPIPEPRQSYGYNRPGSRPGSSNNNSNNTTTKLLTLNKLSSSTTKRQSMISTTTQPPANTRRSMSATTNRSMSATANRRTSLASPVVSNRTSMYKPVNPINPATSTNKQFETKIINLETKLKDLTSEKLKLENDRDNLTSKLQSQQYEMNENLKILEEMQRSVSELQPLLEHYEHELSDKDNKLSKQKTDFEHAREEWRQTMDIMLSDNQASEEFYNQNIQDLKQTIMSNEYAIQELQNQIINFASSSSSNKDSEKTGEENSNPMENVEFKKILARYDLAKIENDKLILEFKTDIIELKNNLKITENELKEKERMIQTLSSKVNQTKSEYDDLLIEKDNKIEELLNQLRTKESEFETLLNENEAKITELENQLKTDQEVNLQISQKESEALQRLQQENKTLQQNLESQKSQLLEERRQIIASKDQEISRLQISILEKTQGNQNDTEEAASLKASIKELIEEKEQILSQNASMFKEKELELTTIKDELHHLRNKETEVEELSRQIETLKINQKSKSDTDLSLTDGERYEELRRLREENITLKEHSPEREELLSQLKTLKQELETRPMLHEVIELEDEIELLEEIRREDIKKTKTEMTIMKDTIRRLEESLERQKLETHRFQKLINQDKLAELNNPSLTDRESVVSNQVIDGELLVYQPPTESKDPSAGRAKWCGLCERDGHDSVDCPYENDMF